MKILQVGKFYSPIKGGIETVIENLSSGLTSKGIGVEVLCSNLSSHTIVEEVNSVPVHRLATYGELFSQPLTISLLKELPRLARQFDVIHFHAPNPLAEFTSLLSRVDRPQLVTYHSDIVRQKALAKCYAPLQDRFLRRMKSVVVGSQQLIDSSEILASKKEKCRVIPFGIDSSQFQLTDSVKKKSAALKEKYQQHVLFVGRLVSYKGLSFLIEAMQELDCKLVIIGKGPLEEELREKANSEKVFFLNRIDQHEDLVAHYHAAEALILPSISRAEAFGMVLLEAMACGTPLITTKLNSGVSFVNQAGVTGLQVEVGSSRALAQAIRQIVFNQELREKFSVNCRQRFVENFTLEKMVDSYLSLYREICR